MEVAGTDWQSGSERTTRTESALHRLQGSFEASAMCLPGMVVRIAKVSVVGLYFLQG